MSESVGGADGGSKDSPGIGGDKGSDWGGESSASGFDSALSEAAGSFDKDPGSWGGDKSPDHSTDGEGGTKPEAAPPDGSLFDGGSRKDVQGPGFGNISGHGPPSFGGLHGLVGPQHASGAPTPAGATWNDLAALTGDTPTPPRPNDARSPPAPEGLANTWSANPPPDLLGVLGAGVAGGDQPILVPAFFQSPAEPPPAISPERAIPVRPGVADEPVGLPGRVLRIPMFLGITLTPWNRQESILSGPELGEDIRLRAPPGSAGWTVEGIRDGRWTPIGRARWDGEGIRIEDRAEVERQLGRPLPGDRLRIDDAGEWGPTAPPVPGFAIETRTEEEAALVDEMRAQGATQAEILNALWGLRNGLPRVMRLEPPEGAPEGTQRYRVGENEITLTPRAGGGYDMTFVIERDYGSLPRSPAVRRAQSEAEARGEPGDLGFHTGAHRFFPGLTETILPGNGRLNAEDWRAIENLIGRFADEGYIVRGSVRALPPEAVRPDQLVLDYEARDRAGQLLAEDRIVFDNRDPRR